MTPEFCTVKHDPENGQYADCVRACVASMLDLPAAKVPHWFNSEDGQAGQLEMQLWLAARGQAAALVVVPDCPLPVLLAFMRDNYPDKHYMLWCDSGGGDHAVVGCNDRIEHNPAWVAASINGPHSCGFWLVWMICNL